MNLLALSIGNFDEDALGRATTVSSLWLRCGVGLSLPSTSDARVLRTTRSVDLPFFISLDDELIGVVRKEGMSLFSRSLWLSALTLLRVGSRVEGREEYDDDDDDEEYEDEEDDDDDDLRRLWPE